MNNNSTEIKIAIESMTSCQGNCTGCLLGVSEKKEENLFLFDSILNKIPLLVRELERNIKNLDCITPLFGQGDHLNMNLEQKHKLAKSAFDIHQGKGEAAVSLSGLGKYEDIVKGIDELYEASFINNNSLYPVIVLDFKKANNKKYKPIYERNINYVRQKFQSLDLAMNIGPDTLDNISPKELHSFIIHNGFKHIQFNLLPTLASQFLFNERWSEIIFWIKDFYENWSLDANYEIDFGFLLNRLIKETENLDISEVKRYIQHHFKYELYIDAIGDVYLIQGGGTGDAIPYSNRYGYKPISNIIKDDIKLIIKKIVLASTKLTSEILKQTNLDLECNVCKYKNACMSSGFFLTKSIMRDVVKPVNDKCHIGYLELFESVEKRRQIIGNHISILDNKGDLNRNINF